MKIAAVTALLLPLLAGFAPAQEPGGRTFAMLVGISHYQKLPQELWLQYPDRDAEAFAKFVASPRGGAVPNDRILVLTNEKATTAAVRAGFHDFLKAAGPKDTVMILVAGHGTVDSHGAYVLTYDSDPGNLEGTALHMEELNALMNGAMAKVGHVVLLADVCRAAAIAGTKTDGLADVVGKIGEESGEMLGLMAARPREVSYESPEYGGGHGAFSYAVLKGLDGAADKDRDGFVTAGELIDYVRGNVSTLTSGKQHPRDFGNMDNATRLADLSKPGAAADFGAMK